MDESLLLLTSGPRRGLASKVGPRAGRGSFVQGWRSLLVAGLALTLAACASPSVPTQEPEAQPSTGEALPTTPQETYQALTQPLDQFAEALPTQPPPDRTSGATGKSVSVRQDRVGRRHTQKKQQ